MPSASNREKRDGPGNKLRYKIKNVCQLIIFVVILLVSIPSNAAEPLVDPGWVKAHLGAPGVVFLDARGGRAYRAGHIPGAVHADYDQGWRTTKAGVPGMLPPTAYLEAKIGGLGIGNADHVVIAAGGYSAPELAIATRIYWTFKVLGHDAVSILDGGMGAYFADKGNRVEKTTAAPGAKTFKANLRHELIATAADVKALGQGGLIDSRSQGQFDGIIQSPAAARPGTIPGAGNLPITALTVNNGGVFRGIEAIRDLYKMAGVPTGGETINFCNTGHLASLGWFVSHQLLGNDKARMYDGSMAEWTRNPANPVEAKGRGN